MMISIKYRQTDRRTNFCELLFLEDFNKSQFSYSISNDKFIFNLKAALERDRDN